MRIRILNEIPSRSGNAIVLSADRNYADYAIVTIQSWLDNASKKARFVVLTDASDWKQMEEYMNSNLRLANGSSLEVCFIHDLVDMNGMQLRANADYITKATYYRLLIPLLMPDCSKVLYMDSDMCVVKPMEEAFNTTFSSSEAIAGVEDFLFLKSLPKAMKNTIGLKGLSADRQQAIISKYGNSYIEWYAKEMGIVIDDQAKYMNGGLVLFDVQKCRQLELVENMFDLIERQNSTNGWIHFADQDILNSVFNGRIRWLPIEWNAFWYFATTYIRKVTMARRHLQKENEEYLEKILNNARIWHYTGPKPWNKPQMNYAVASHWWKACSKTPLLERHLSKFSNTMQQHILESIEGQQRTLQEFLS